MLCLIPLTAAAPSIPGGYTRRNLRLVLEKFRANIGSLFYYPIKSIDFIFL